MQIAGIAGLISIFKKLNLAGIAGRRSYKFLNI